MVKIHWQVISENQKAFVPKKLPEVNILRYRNLDERKISRKKTDK